MPLRVRLSIAFVAIVIVPLAVTVFLIQFVISRNLDLGTKDNLSRASNSVSAVLEQLQSRAAAAALDVADTPAIQQAVRDDTVDGAQRLVLLKYEAARQAGVAPDFIAIAAADGAPIATVGRAGRFLGGAEGAPSAVELAASGDASPYAVFGRSTLRSPDGVLGSVVSGFWIDETTLRKIGTAVARVDVAAFFGERAIASTVGTAPPQSLPPGAGLDPDKPVRRGGEFASRVPTSNGLQLVVTAHRDQTAGQVPDLWPTLIPIVFVFVFVAGMLGWVLARVTTKPLQELSDAAMNIASGNFDTRIVVRPTGEVGRLAIAFNAMTDEVSTYIDALQHSRDELRRNLTRMGDTLSSTHDMDKMLSVILETAMVTLQAEAGAVMLFTANRDELYIKVGRDLADRVESTGLRVKIGDGIAGAVGRSGEPMHGSIGDGPHELRLAPGEPRARAVIAVPLKAHGRTLGVLNLYDKIGAREFDDADVTTIRSFANQATVAIDNVLLHQESQRLSITDGLTGLWNYRYFQMTIDKEIERASRFGRPLSLLMLDLDKFKVVNDTFGHQRGDSVLIELATRIKGAIREVDTLARYGGEEFVLVLPETDIEGAEQAAEKLCELVRQRRFGNTNEETLKLTVSIGVAVFPDHAASPGLLVRAADTALYVAKDAGRDRYAVAERVVLGDDTVPSGLPPLDARSRSALESAAASVAASGSDPIDIDFPLGSA